MSSSSIDASMALAPPPPGSGHSRRPTVTSVGVRGGGHGHTNSMSARHTRTGSTSAAVDLQAAATPDDAIAALKAELAESQAARRALEAQLESLGSNHATEVASLSVKHAAELSELSRSLRVNNDEALERQERNHADQRVEERFQLEQSMRAKLALDSKQAHERDRAEWREEAASLRATIDAKEQQLKRMHEKSVSESVALHQATITAQRLQTAVDLTNRQLRFGQDYRLILLHVTCKLFAVRYRQYKAHRDLHTSLGAIVRNASDHERRDQHHSQSSTRRSTAVGSFHVTAPHSAQSSSAPSPGLAPAVPSSSSRVTFLAFEPDTTDDVAPTRRGGQQNETAEWLARDRATWQEEKAAFSEAALARRVRCEKIEFKLQYQIHSPVVAPVAPAANGSSTPVSTTPKNGQSATTNHSTAHEYRRLRAHEKRTRALAEDPGRRTNSIFTHWLNHRISLVSEALPIIAIALQESFDRERISFATTKLFQEKNTQLMLDLGTIQTDQRAVAASQSKWKRQIAALRLRLIDAQAQVCACATIASFAAHDQTQNMQAMCVCDCIHECECVVREIRRRQQTTSDINEAGEEKQQEGDGGLEIHPARDPNVGISVDIPSSVTLPSSCLHSGASSKHTSQPTSPRSLATFASRFGTALGSGRNARTHAVLNGSAAATRGNSDPNAPPKDDPQSVPFLQRTIQSLRSRLNAARTTILTLQGEIVTSGLRKEGGDRLAQTLPVTGPHANSQQPPLHSGAQTHRVLGQSNSVDAAGSAPDYVSAFGSRSARFAPSSHTSSHAQLPPQPLSIRSSASLANLARPLGAGAVSLSSASNVALSSGVEDDLAQTYAQATNAAARRPHVAPIAKPPQSNSGASVRRRRAQPTRKPVPAAAAAPRVHLLRALDPSPPLAPAIAPAEVASPLPLSQQRKMATTTTLPPLPAPHI